MKKKKILILLFTLSFPVILYLFLRSYGENEFALPVYFDDEEKLYCDVNDETQVDSIKVFGMNLKDSLKLTDIYGANYKIIHFPKRSYSDIQTLKNELNRVLNTFEDLSINIVSLMTISTDSSSHERRDPFLQDFRAKSLLYPKEDSSKLVNCIYAFPTEQWGRQHPSEEVIPIENTLVLLDRENKIRGYYNGYETKEVDRLIIEIRVLISNQ